MNAKVDVQQIVVEIYELLINANVPNPVERVRAATRAIGLKASNSVISKWISEYAATEAAAYSDGCVQQPSSDLRLPFEEGWMEIATRVALPSKAGVYAIFDGSSIVYIGSANNLYTRLTSTHHHILRKYPSGAIRVRVVGQGKHRIVERSLIERFRPIENVMYAK